MQACNVTAIGLHSYPKQDSNCVDLVDQPNAHCWGGSYCTANCYATESTANNFIGLRSMTGSTHGNKLYAEFQTGVQSHNLNIDFSKPDFKEFYDLDLDPWEMNNLAASQDTTAMAKDLHAFFNCAGSSCP